LRAAVTAAALLGMALAWQALALALVRLPPMARAIAAVGDAAEPVLLAAVGLYCLVGSVLIPVGGGGSGGGNGGVGVGVGGGDAPLL